MVTAPAFHACSQRARPLPSSANQAAGPSRQEDHAARISGDDLGDGFDGGIGDNDLRGHESVAGAGRPGPLGMTLPALVVERAAFFLDGAEQPAHRREGRRLAGGRLAERRLPQHQGLGPGRRDAHHDARAAEAGECRQHRLRDIVRRRRGRRGRVARPVAPWLRQKVERERRNGRAPFLEEAEVDFAPGVRGGLCRGKGRTSLRPGWRNVGVE